MRGFKNTCAAIVLAGIAGWIASLWSVSTKQILTAIHTDDQTLVQQIRGGDNENETTTASAAIIADAIAKSRDSVLQATKRDHDLILQELKALSLSSSLPGSNKTSIAITEKNYSDASIIGGGSNNCVRALDALDLAADRRRSARQGHTSRRPEKTRWFDVFEPEAVCLSEERFGSDVRHAAYGDGPKFTCGVDVLAKKYKEKTDDDVGAAGGCLVYSIGSNNQIDFERAVHNFMGCETYTFDPTLDSPFKGGEYATFYPWGLGKDGEEKKGGGKSWVGRSFRTIIGDLGHENRTIDVLKIDCEGCEYEVMPPLFEDIASGKVRVDQVLIELHLRGMSSADQIDDFFAAADKARLRIFHKERNHWGCQGYSCVEYALVSESFLREANGAIVCPSDGGR